MKLHPEALLQASSLKLQVGLVRACGLFSSQGAFMSCSSCCLVGFVGARCRWRPEGEAITERMS